MAINRHYQYIQELQSVMDAVSEKQISVTDAGHRIRAIEQRATANARTDKAAPMSRENAFCQIARSAERRLPDIANGATPELFAAMDSFSESTLSGQLGYSVRTGEENAPIDFKFNFQGVRPH